MDIYLQLFLIPIIVILGQINILMHIWNLDNREDFPWMTSDFKPSIFVLNRLSVILEVNVLEEVLNNIPLNLRYNILYMGNGRSAHNSRILRDFLNENFPNRNVTDQ